MTFTSDTLKEIEQRQWMAAAALYEISSEKSFDHGKAAPELGNGAPVHQMNTYTIVFMKLHQIHTANH
jgi:hypothetical protein